jgi:hypothetical protein
VRSGTSAVLRRCGQPSGLVVFEIHGRFRRAGGGGFGAAAIGFDAASAPLSVSLLAVRRRNPARV